MSFGGYPYTSARVKAMKATLLKPQDYVKLHHMGYSEIARFLEEGEYREGINKFTGTHSGLELIELGLNENFAGTMEQLLTISNRKEVRELIETYVLKWVLNNYKLILKVKMGLLSAEEMATIQIPIRPTDYHAASQLLQEEASKTIREVSLRIPVGEDTLFQLFEKKDIIALETAIDRGYYKKLLMLVKRMRLLEADPLKRFMNNIITLTNIKTIIRMKDKGAEKEAILQALIPAKHSDLIHSLAGAGDLSTLLSQLKPTVFSLLSDEQILKDISLVESRAEAFLYKTAYSLLHKQPLSVSSVFGFLLLKEIEVRNLRLFIHAKALNLGKEFIEENMVN